MGERRTWQLACIFNAFRYFFRFNYMHENRDGRLRCNKKYDPQLKINTEVRSPDDYYEIFSQAEDLERKLSRLKEEAPPVIVKAIMQREAAKLIPFFHMEMVYLFVLMFTYTPWMK